MLLKIGDLAGRTGLTVRILHHYDKVGLLTPSVRTDAGYRLYDRADVAKLYRIQALRRLNLSLSEVAQMIDGEGAALASVVDQQIHALERQITQSIALRDQLKEFAGFVSNDAEPDLDFWLSTLEMLSVLDKYFNKEEAASLLIEMRKRRDGKLEKAMYPIIAKVRALMEAKVAVSDQRAQDISTLWLQTMNQAMPDPRVLNNFSLIHRNEASLQSFSGVDGAVMDYVTRASIEVRYSIYQAHLNEDELRFFRASFFKNSQAWIEVFAEMRNHLDAGIPATDPVVQKTLTQWQLLFSDAWGNDLDVMTKVRAIHMKEQKLSTGGGLTPELLDYARTGMQYLAQNSQKSRSKK